MPASHPDATAGDSTPAVVQDRVLALHQFLSVIAASLSSPGVTVDAVVKSCGLNAQAVAAFEVMIGGLVLGDRLRSSTVSSESSVTDTDTSDADGLHPANPAQPFRNSGPFLVGRLYKVVPQAPLALASERGLEPDDVRWYAVSRGTHVGVTTINALAVDCISGVSDGRQKSFSTQIAAAEYFNQLLSLGVVAVLP
ncbi:hypothetical protein C8F01DRAFT_1252355 [Mycena amicta]|nr:hypothetical protein C8F01DRAFT_1252355 [Mycena amicta]